MAENKHLGLVLVAIVALVAVVGLVMLFTTGQFKQFGKIEAVTTPEGGESGALVGEAIKSKAIPYDYEFIVKNVADESIGITATCPQGKIVLGGGCRALSKEGNYIPLFASGPTIHLGYSGQVALQSANDWNCVFDFDKFMTDEILRTDKTVYVACAKLR